MNVNSYPFILFFLTPRIFLFLRVTLKESREMETEEMEYLPFSDFHACCEALSKQMKFIMS